MNAKRLESSPVSQWRRLSFMACAALLAIAPGFSHAAGVFVEEMTWTEVRDAIEGGATTALIYVGSTEQNGPHMVLGKHNVVAREVARRVAIELGDVLVYPVLPFAITGDLSRHDGHLRFPGTVSLRPSTFRSVLRDVAESAIAAGARHVFLAGDHGGGQAEIRSLAASLDGRWRATGVRIHFLSDPYDLQWKRAVARAAAAGLHAGGHAGLVDTSELMALEPGDRYVRRDRIFEVSSRPSGETGVEGDPAGANDTLGRQGIDDKVSLAVAQIRHLRALNPVGRSTRDPSTMRSVGRSNR